MGPFCISLRNPVLLVIPISFCKLRLLNLSRYCAAVLLYKKA